MTISQLLTMTPPEIEEYYKVISPILEVGGNGTLPSRMPIVKSYTHAVVGSITLKEILEYLSNPQKWCIHHHTNPSGRPGNPKLIVATVNNKIIPKGQLRVDDIRYAFGGAVNYKEIVDSYNSQDTQPAE